MSVEAEGLPSGGTETRSAGRKFRPLRTWPALLFVVAIVALRFGPRLFESDPGEYFIVSALGPLACSLLIVLWWVFASRACWKERLFGFLGLGGCVFAGHLIIDSTMRGAGLMFIVVPLGLILFVIAVHKQRHEVPLSRTTFALGFALLGCLSPALLRNEGMTGDYALVLRWRWTPTTEEQMMAARQGSEAAPAIGAADVLEVFSDPEWPGFRGKDRSGRALGPKIDASWEERAPELLWRIDVGPGWGSFAIAGNRLFTQEQRGPMECVVCYDGETGDEVWIQRTEVRFDEPLGGAGPRATPTLDDGRLFITGADGDFLRLDPGTGNVVWRQSLREVAGRKPPTWGFSASPLVVGPNVIVHGGGEGDLGVLAFDAESGELAWSAPSGDHSYSSPQIHAFSGAESVVMLTNSGLDLIDPTSGAFHFRYDWPVSDYRALQPAILKGDVVLIPSRADRVTRALRIIVDGGEYSAEEIWSSRYMKPDFNDFVVHDGHAYGFDGGIFASINLETGDRNWKGGRYGKGQVLLLEQSKMLLVASERGDVVLLQADPTELIELGSFKAIEGKTWNHPVVVEDRLFIRNGQEAACFRLPLVADEVVVESVVGPESD